jgi:hypothetical protein
MLSKAIDDVDVNNLAVASPPFPIWELTERYLYMSCSDPAMGAVKPTPIQRFKLNIDTGVKQKRPERMHFNLKASRIEIGNLVKVSKNEGR